MQVIMYCMNIKIHMLVLLHCYNKVMMVSGGAYQKIMWGQSELLLKTMHIHFTICCVASAT